MNQASEAGQVQGIFTAVALLDAATKKRFGCGMKTSISQFFQTTALIFLLCVGCKPAEKNSVPPAPPVTAPAEVVAPATNEAAASEAPAPALSDGSITPEEARNHIGQTAVVRGKVDRVYVSQKGDVFIDMGGKHPNAPFTAVCFAQAIPTDQLQQLNGKVISVKGKIKNYQGKVEIVLESPEQLGQ